MKRVGDWRENAKACRELAHRMPPEQRQQLMEMAAAWEEIARERETALTSVDDRRPEGGDDQPSG